MTIPAEEEEELPHESEPEPIVVEERHRLDIETLITHTEFDPKIVLVLLQEITSLFKEHDIPYIIVFGTLIGLHRDNKLLPWDNDCDISLSVDYYHYVQEVITPILLTRCIQMYRSKPSRYCENVHSENFMSMISFIKNGTYIDFYFRLWMPEMKRGLLPSLSSLFRSASHYTLTNGY